MLCVSADTMAKFNHASVEMKDFEKKIESFIQSNEKPDKVIVQIRLAGEECTITWSQRHFMRLVALYTKAWFHASAKLDHARPRIVGDRRQTHAVGQTILHLMPDLPFHPFVPGQQARDASLFFS